MRAAAFGDTRGKGRFLTPFPFDSGQQKFTIALCLVTGKAI